MLEMLLVTRLDKLLWTLALPTADNTNRSSARSVPFTIPFGSLRPFGKCRLFFYVNAFILGLAIKTFKCPAQIKGTEGETVKPEQKV